MQTLSATIQQASSPPAASNPRLIHTYLGWEISLSRVVIGRVDKGLWLHWYHPADLDRTSQERQIAIRYGYFVAPTQTLEEALYAVCQSIDAIVELESMEHNHLFVPQRGSLERYWQELPIAG